MIGAVKDDVESLKAFGEELLAFFKKKEQDHISSFSFVVLQTLDGLLALHPSDCCGEFSWRLGYIYGDYNTSMLEVQDEK